MNFDSYSFLLFAFFAVVSLRFCGGTRGRELLLLVINLLFLASFASSIGELFPLLAFVGLGYVVVWSAKRIYYTCATFGLAILVTFVFVWLKRYSIIAGLPRLPFQYSTVGLSYILFRVLHLLVDVSQEAASLPSPLRFFNYTIFFPTFVSGPIQRYQDFEAQLVEGPIKLTSEAMDRLLQRILTGFLLLLAVANPLKSETTGLQAGFYSQFDQGRWLSAAINFAVAGGCYGLFLYINFVAYMAIVIGVGGLAGFALPENFDRPLNTANFLDLWSRWHITLSNWFKFYVFNPLLKASAERWSGFLSIYYLGVIAFFVTFVLMGIWHGTTGLFVVYGLLLGLGVTINRIWQLLLQQRLKKEGYRTLCLRSWYADASRALALGYFAMALSCIWIDAAWGLKLAGPGGFVVCVLALMCLMLAGFASIRVVRLAGPLANVGWQWFLELSGRSFRISPEQWSMTSIGAKIVVVIILAALLNVQSPEIVYKGY
jgi:D-alanyl-lipoteichoic acid acyltransferase DltB (MBOAT superfamily)